MSFCQHFFGKEIDQVDFADVCNLILDRPDLERTFLECKACEDRDLQMKKYTPSIVGFLNTDGGLLIIGVPKEQGRPRRFQLPFMSHSYIPKDHLRDKLLGSIQPLPDGIQIETIKEDNRNNQCVTLVDISRSEYPPHQYNGTYYIRLDGCNKPAPHAFVEALFNGRRPRYQQALIEHFERKIARFRENEKAMTALYFLVLEHRVVPEPIIYKAVLGADQMKTERERELREALSKLSELGVLISEETKGPAIYSGQRKYDIYMKHSINPDYQDLLADIVFERHRQKEFHLYNV